MTKQLKNYINGEWTDSSQTDDRNEVLNPATQEVIAYAPRTTKEETEEAIRVARETYESGVWSDLTVHERAAYLDRIADQIDEHFEELVDLEVANNLFYILLLCRSSHYNHHYHYYLEGLSREPIYY